MFKHVRCNPDVAPRVTSGGYEDTVDVFYPNQNIVHRGANFNVMMIMTIVSVEQPLSWGRMFKPVH